MTPFLSLLHLGFMHRRLLIFWVLLFLVPLGVAFGQGSEDQDSDPITGYAIVPGEVQFELLVSPPAASPGDELTVTFSVVNNSKETAIPQLIAQMPAEIAPTARGLPASSSFSPVDRSLSWQPVIPPGEQRAFDLTFVANVVDVANPIQDLRANFIHAQQDVEVNARYWVGAPPAANIFADQTQTAIGQPIQLAASITGSGPISQVWDLGDGRRVEAENPTIQYATAGEFPITLFAANPLSVVTATTSIVVAAAPEAFFTLDDATPAINQQILFQNHSGGAPPLAYFWDFGDGAVSQEQSPRHQYQQSGNFVATLSVQSGTGRKSFALPITVGSPPTAAIATLPETVVAGESISAVGVGDADITVYHWDMGDGNLLEGQQVSHVYVKDGLFYVWLLAENDYGVTQIGQWVTVTPGSNLFTAFLPTIMQDAGIESTPPALATASSETEVSTDNNVTISVERQVEPFTPIFLEPAPLPAEATEAEQLLWYVNEARRLHQLSPLEYNFELSVAAQRHTEDMAANQFTEHVGSDGSRPYDRFVQYGYAGKYGGEATAWGFAEARRAVEFWVNSPGHRRIILNPDAIDLGVGYSVDFSASNVWYWVAEFGEPN